MWGLVVAEEASLVRSLLNPLVASSDPVSPGGTGAAELDPWCGSLFIPTRLTAPHARQLRVSRHSVDIGWSSTRPPTDDGKAKVEGEARKGVEEEEGKGEGVGRSSEWQRLQIELLTEG